MKKFIFSFFSVLIVLSCCATAAFATSNNSLSEVQRVYDDPNATVCDVIRVTNPDLYASMSEKQRADFDAINYQDAKAVATENRAAPRYVNWTYLLVPRLDCGTKGKIKYYVDFISEATGGPSECSLIGLTCNIYDLTEDERVGFDSESDTNTATCSLSGSLSGAISGHTYENECEAYGYDPLGIPFVFFESCTARAK